MNSDLIRFEIFVNNVNEFPPILQPVLTSITIVEPGPDAPLENIVNEFRFDCSDRDINSSLGITLDSIHYVSKYDINRVLESNTYDLGSVFHLVFANQTNTTRDFKTAYLAYLNALDYEKLLTPTETILRLEVSCSDGEFEAKSKVDLIFSYEF